MHPLPQRTLHKLVVRYGLKLCEDPRRTEALLRDLCGQHRREIFVLVNAQRNHVPRDLLAAPRWLPKDVLHTQLSRRLQSELALTAEAADWAVASWATALGVAQVSSRQANCLRLLRNIGVQLNRRLATFPVVFSDFTRDRRVQPTRTGLLLRTMAVRLLLAGAAMVLLGIRWNPSPSPDSLISTVAPGTKGGQGWAIAEHVSHLQDLYPVPRPAWVVEGPLNVRQNPSMTANSLGFLPVEREVTVVAFSPDARWSEISTPYPGWVSNDYLFFLADQPPTIRVRLAVEQAEITASILWVRSGPGVNFATADRLGPHQSIVAVASTLDGNWKQIVRPVQGWLNADHVREHQ